MDSLRSQIAERVDAYLSEAGMSARRFGVLAVGSEHFARRLKAGTSIRLSTVERALAWMADHPPGDTTGE